MNTFIYGFFFFVVGTALLIYNKSLVERSKEFYPKNLSLKEIEELNSFNQFLCLLTGLITSVNGFLIMLNLDQ